MKHVRPETPINGGGTVLVTESGDRILADAVPGMLAALEKTLPWLEEVQTTWTKANGSPNEVLCWRIKELTSFPT